METPRKTKIALASFTLVILTSTAAMVLCGPFGSFRQTEAAPLLIGRDSEKVKELLRLRLEAVKAEHDARDKEFLAGRGTLDILLSSDLRLLNSELDVGTKPADRLAAYQAHLDRAEEYRKINQTRFDAGRIAVQDKLQTDYHKMDAEIQLERAKLR